MSHSSRLHRNECASPARSRSRAVGDIIPFVTGLSAQITEKISLVAASGLEWFQCMCCVSVGKIKQAKKLTAR